MTAIGTGLAAVGAVALPGPSPAPALRLAAAAQTTAVPAEGAYWHTRTLWKGTSQQAGRGKNRYRLEKQELLERWTSPDGRTWSGYREFGLRPRSAADEAAWRRDGSPSIKPNKSWLVPGKDQKGDPVLGFYVVDRLLSYEQVRALPTDPAGLKAWVDKASRDPNSGVSDDTRDIYIRGTLVSMLSEVPVKEVRAAAYEALPTMPGVRSLGKDEDPRGRTGQGFLIDHQQGSGKWQQKHTITGTTRLIVDTGTMTPLAFDTKTTMDGEPFPTESSTTITLQAGWTDDKPAVPALP
ncbi:CU044_5270 family protein [Streptosporangium sp. CA-135522]|uniref:CU044_5270 family protein n=1 Tax=Streptosporangium sp. CA-135522 TaxID=3240072 RepID=UPI003D8B346F